jgi:5'/3'-nucleotidase SurE
MIGFYLMVHQLGGYNLGTPSTCANIGLHYVAGDTPYDLVISGPNFGRNSSTVFTLGSGTIGGAMEAALVHREVRYMLMVVWI